MSRWRAATVVASSPLLGALVLFACGGTPAPPVHPSIDAATNAAEGGDGPRATVAATELDALAARGATEAPLMRELLRIEHVLPTQALPTAPRDTCLRIVFSASRDVRAWLADETGAMRGDSTRARSGTIPPRGPACAKKGEALRLLLSPDTTDVEMRAILFASP